ncbi:PadR family transcriptional regulator [Flavilitoribacter nigricans]|uniref:PadR family transcriptional regulator n=1 Tax=Flavilitoribacter nigricans (strain ATCC 23147 / DSM 23189 / NBRC 102662 / NCIMB 1420 / SS-2) TaxID=1122177 RepID=A0A2D0N663_FLAN2|nr:PadR family transcriptional regulator [Flavilitoribacter nigricans]PHN04001.1 PadR family transcriptional regulator [Flavilitoribacter nigricans DSM 23189 = NBRC 102662]
MYSKELLKGTLKPILLKLLSDRGAMYGYEIVQAVKQMSLGKIVIKEGSLYPLLHALLAEGILETESRKVDGRTRKYYALSKKGKTETVSALGELEDFMSTIKLILTTKPTTQL